MSNKFVAIISILVAVSSTTLSLFAPPALATVQVRAVKNCQAYHLDGAPGKILRIGEQYDFQGTRTFTNRPLHKLLFLLK